MKKRYINLLLIIMLVASLTLSGCTSKDESKDVQVDTEQEGEMGQSEGKEIEDEEVEDQKDNDEIKAGQEEEQEENKEDVEKVEQTEDTEGAEDTKEKDQLEEMAEKLTEKVEQLEQQEAEDESSENNQEKNQIVEAEEETNTLKVEGKVENELQLSLDDLKEMDDIIFQGDFYSLNNFGTTAHTNFKGINLWMLLEKEAKISTEATKVTVIATDGYKMEFTIEEVKRQDYIDETDEEVKLPIIIAWERNGEEYDSLEGPPFKLIIGQREPGDINKPQWVSNIDKITVE